MSYHGVVRRQQGRVLANDDNDVAAALARLSETSDGDLFLRWIHQQTIGRTLPDDASDGALRASEARKSFAATIYNMLDRGLKRNASAKRNGD
jgi:hypothetical protein